MTVETNPQIEIELEVGPVAHGGHCVARHEGRVVFVRHTLPGERVRARVTDAGDNAKFWRADAIEILVASPDRVESVWPAAGPGGVGGGELAHVALPAQRRWKAAVLREQLSRLAKIDRDVLVESASGDDERGGLAYRTRIDLVADADGKAGMLRPRSHDVVALDTMPLATEEVTALADAESVFTREWTPGARLELAAPSAGGAPVLLVDGVPVRGGKPDVRPNARKAVQEVVAAGGAEYQYRLPADGFWQVHRGAPALLTNAVLAGLGDVTGARVLDLYAGAGLFTAPLANGVGESGTVVAIEGDPDAVRSARRNAHGLANVELHHGSVDRVLGGGVEASGADAVVLDPPRVGAGRRVVERIVAMGPKTVVYVACDPAALARDIGYFVTGGYTLKEVRGFDLFPHTHHVEAVAVLEKQ